MLIDFGNVAREGEDAWNYPVAFLNLGPAEKYCSVPALSSFGCNAPGTYLSEQPGGRDRLEAELPSKPFTLEGGARDEE